jgi:hypothetical protein
MNPHSAGCWAPRRRRARHRVQPSAQKTELLVYTALETDQLKAYTESFQKTNPNIDLKFVRDSPESSPPRCWRRRRIPRPT